VTDNPLVAAPVDTATTFSGAGLLDSGTQLAQAIQSGNWVEGGMAAFSTALDTAATVSDPLGSLIAAGLGWLMDHLEPLKGWLNDLTGDAGEVQAFSQTWSNIAQQLATAGTELDRVVQDVESQKGQSMDAYRAIQTEAAKQIAGAGDWAGGFSKGLGIASMIVQVVHDLVRDAIAQIVGSAISWAAEAVFSLGLATPWIIEQVSTRVSSLVAKIGGKLKALLASVKKLSSLLEDLKSLFKRQGDELDTLLRGGKTSSPIKPDGTKYSVAYEMELHPDDVFQSRKVHFNRANEALDDAMKSDPDFAAGMETMSPGVGTRVERPGGRRNPDPADFIWHHAHPDTVGGRPGVMQLVPTYQHTPGSDFWLTLHPGGRGGFSIWGDTSKK